MEQLRSRVWSSETLVAGMQNVSRQPKRLLVKAEDEPDQELVEQLNYKKLSRLVDFPPPTN